MRIDVFFDVYPHPAKPYFEAQLSEWHRQGHALRLFSLGQIPGATSQFDFTFIRTLRQRPLQLARKVALRILTQPARCLRIWRAERGFASKVKRLVTDAQLPTDTPDVFFMHNLATAVHFSYLKHAAPRTTLAIYYHGGEIPGVRQIPLAVSAQTLGRADVIFSNTEASVNEVIGRGAPRERTVRVPVGFPLDRFTQPADRAYLPDQRWRFVCLGRMAPEKGFDVVLRACAALRTRQPNFHLTLIGTGPQLPALKALAAQLELDEHVTFAGFIDLYQEMNALLARYDALIISSLPVPGSNWRETQACVMQEAMLMGACVIASDIGGIRESLPSFLHPYLYTPGSQDELLMRLVAMMAIDETTLRSMGQNARRFVEEHYDIRAVNRQLLARLDPVNA